MHFLEGLWGWQIPASNSHLHIDYVLVSVLDGESNVGNFHHIN
jgi:hypothetical protein